MSNKQDSSLRSQIAELRKLRDQTLNSNIKPNLFKRYSYLKDISSFYILILLLYYLVQ
jgi:hypothetical protein